MKVRSHRQTFAEFETNSDQPLMQLLLDRGIPVSSSCLGKGICGKCRVQIISGDLTPPMEAEMRVMQKNQIPHGFRLSCQIKVESDLEIDASYW